MLMSPIIDPVALRIGPIAVHWYGLMYLLGFTLAWALGCYRIRQNVAPISRLEWDDLLFYAMLGVILGGRMGYMLFYDLHTLLVAPWTFFMVWRGGMSFHGGLLGVLVAVWYFARRQHHPLLAVTDFLVPLVPLGLGAGRIGNFINGELWGRVTTAPWGVIFPQAGWIPRHPTPLYEASLEGLVLFLILWWYSRIPRYQGAVSGFFLMMYGVFRCFVEIFRQPDPQWGYLAFGWLTMGQLLSLPMILCGFGLILRATKVKV